MWLSGRAAAVKAPADAPMEPSIDPPIKAAPQPRKGPIPSF